MMAKQFNIGDKVRVVRERGDDCMLGVKIGGTATILRDFDGDHYRVEYENNSGGTNRGYALPNSIELVEAKPSKSERISLLESQVADLTAKVEVFMRTAEFAATQRRKPAVALTQTPTIHNVTINLGESTVKTAEEISEVFRKFVATASSATLSKPSPNQQRKAVIERAKAFVAERTVKKGIAGYKTGVNIKSYVCDVQFIVNTEKRVVTLLAKGVTTGKVRAKAIAKCAPDDVFNADIGKAIALGRALGLDVSEFENAVKPTEFVKGHRFKTSYDLTDGNIGRVTDVKKADKYAPLRFYHDIMGGYIPFDKAIILDDTDAKY